MGSASDKTSEKVPPEVSESLCPVDDTISTGLALYCILIFILHICRGAMRKQSLVSYPESAGISSSFFSF
jgi:hypothetical protein